jgi:hypothetical protein
MAQTHAATPAFFRYNGLTVPSLPAFSGLRALEHELLMSLGTERVVTTCVTVLEKKISSRYGITSQYSLVCIMNSILMFSWRGLTHSWAYIAQVTT